MSACPVFSIATRELFSGTWSLTNVWMVAGSLQCIGTASVTPRSLLTHSDCTKGPVPTAWSRIHSSPIVSKTPLERMDGAAPSIPNWLSGSPK